MTMMTIMAMDINTSMDTNINIMVNKMSRHHNNYTSKF